MLADQKLLDRAGALKKEAGRIVKELGLLEILAKVGDPVVVGSAETGLMIAPDVDIHVHVQEYEIGRVVSLLSTLALLHTIQKVQFNNYRELRRDYRRDHAHFPHAYYVGIRSLQPSGEWKVDMWFGRKDDITMHVDPRLNRLSDKQRAIILRLKEEWKAEGKGYRDGVLSIDFYKAVMDRGVTDKEAFKQYLNSKL